MGNLPIASEYLVPRPNTPALVPSRVLDRSVYHIMFLREHVAYTFSTQLSLSTQYELICSFKVIFSDYCVTQDSPEYSPEIHFPLWESSSKSHLCSP